MKTKAKGNCRILLVLMVVILLTSCRIWFQQEVIHECVRYDKSFNVGFTTTSYVDSISYFINGIQMCQQSFDSSLDHDRGEYGFQGLHVDNSYGASSYQMNCFGSRSANDYTFIKVDECIIGNICDNFSDEITSLIVVVQYLDKRDSIKINKNELFDFAYNNKIRVFPKSDSVIACHLEEMGFSLKGCQDEYCISGYSSDSLLCIDLRSSESNRIKRNICEPWYRFWSKH